MSALLHCLSQFTKREDLHRFLRSGQQVGLSRGRTQVVSISHVLKSVNPIAALRLLAGSKQPHFFMSKAGQESALGEDRRFSLAAIGSTWSQPLQGQHRFEQAKALIQRIGSEILIDEDLKIPFSGPHFFCSFTFDETLAKSEHKAGEDHQVHFPIGAITLPRWQISCQDDRCVIVANLPLSSDADLHALTEEVWSTYQKLDLLDPASSFTVHPRLNTSTPASKDPQQFRAIIEAAIQAVRSGHLDKVVLAQAVDMVLPQPINLFEAIQHLQALYPDCYVFSIGNGRGQYFIGASPERLLSVRQDHFAIDALAGSAPRGHTPAEETIYAQQLLVSQKDLHEHHVVVNYIQDRLTQLGLDLQVADSPQLLKLSNIQHLRTLIQGKIPEHLHLFDLLAVLHPTAAVAGVPREKACEFIYQHESFSRELYAAPLGWVDTQGNGEFAVGIRSALIQDRRVRLYAGAGIVADSDPDLEVAEVQLKLQALLQALL
jgi:menaquinone-specific isochorismate synthase